LADDWEDPRGIEGAPAGAGGEGLTSDQEGGGITKKVRAGYQLAPGVDPLGVGRGVVAHDQAPAVPNRCGGTDHRSGGGREMEDQDEDMRVGSRLRPRADPGEWGDLAPIKYGPEKVPSRIHSGSNLSCILSNFALTVPCTTNTA